MSKIAIASIILALAVVAGAFGAHLLREKLTPDHLRSWQTAVDYQFYHGLGLLLVALIPDSFVKNHQLFRLVSVFLLAGIIMFSGSIYFLSTTEITGMEAKWLGPITPIGGLFFIVGWLLLAFSVGKKELKN